MLIKQISVFLENKSGRLAEVTKLLGENNIDISALSIADTSDFGILRLIVSNPDGALLLLKENNYSVSTTNVLAISVPDSPGGLATALIPLEKENIGIEYMYAFIGKLSNEALVILRIENVDLAIEVLLKNNINILPSKEIYRL